MTTRPVYNLYEFPCANNAGMLHIEIAGTDPLDARRRLIAELDADGEGVEVRGSATLLDRDVEPPDDD